MISHKSDRHPKLKTPTSFGLEFSLLGLECNEFRDLAEQLSMELPHISWLVLDAQHHEHSFIPEAKLIQQDKRLLATGETIEQVKQLFAGLANITIVNGNHYTAKAQIIFTSSVKSGSVQRRKDQVSDLRAVVKRDIPWELFSVQTGLESMNAFDNLENTQQLIAWFAQKVTTPKLKAIVLAGGRSERMGQDKVSMEINGMPQWLHTAEILSRGGLEVFISTRQDRQNEFQGYPVITDRFNDMGPYGGILSAFMHDPDSAWLVVATDMPGIDAAIVSELLEKRSTQSQATAFRNGDGKAEPLLAIYEPSAFAWMLKGIHSGISCPARWLKSAEVNWLEIKDQSRFTNLNTPQDLEQWLKMNRR